MDVAELPTAWQRAKTALRFTHPNTHPPPPDSKQGPILVAYEQLGGFAAVAHHVPVEAINQIEDVRVLDQLAAEPGGDDMIRTLESVAATESLRSAAKILHLHYNSVAHRVAKAEQVVGFVIAESYLLSRLMLALVLQRLRDSHPVTMVPVQRCASVSRLANTKYSKAL
ncbi:MAG: helix-turn-helix domain-containing protein [Nakamurella sp.]